MQEIDALKEKVKLTKQDDIDQAKDRIIEELNREIVSRYYLQSGLIESSFNYDPEVQKAIEVLSDDATYTKILSPSN